MTEKEKMLNQEFYDTWDASLIEEREVTRNLIFEFNQINPTKREERRAFVEKLIPNIGEKSWIESPFTCEYGGNMYIGDNFYSNTNCMILDCVKVTIGNDVLFGPNVSLYTPNHAFDPEERKAGLEQTLPITIGDNV